MHIASLIAFNKELEKIAISSEFIRKGVAGAVAKGVSPARLQAFESRSFGKAVSHFGQAEGGRATAAGMNKARMGANRAAAAQAAKGSTQLKIPKLRAEAGTQVGRRRNGASIPPPVAEHATGTSGTFVAPQPATKPPMGRFAKGLGVGIGGALGGAGLEHLHQKRQEQSNERGFHSGF